MPTNPTSTCTVTPSCSKLVHGPRPGSRVGYTVPSLIMRDVRLNRTTADRQTPTRDRVSRISPPRSHVPSRYLIQFPSHPLMASMFALLSHIFSLSLSLSHTRNQCANRPILFCSPIVLYPPSPPFSRQRQPIQPGKRREGGGAGTYIHPRGCLVGEGKPASQSGLPSDGTTQPRAPTRRLT